VARIHHAELWGLEKAKRDWLEGHDATDTPWQDIEPKAGFYLFIPRDEAREAVYSAFAPVPQDVWEYRVGGYQVCEKWLKDRRQRRLRLDDIKTYCRIVTALGLTIGIQEAIDALYPRIEQRLIEIDLP